MPIPIAVQLYSVRQDCAQDLLGTISKVKAMGYDGVEFAGYHGHSAADIRDRLAAEGLKIAGAHVGYALFNSDQIEETIAFHRELGCNYLIVPGLPEETRNTPEACRETAIRLNEIAAALKPHDMRTGFHSHSVDMAKLSDGKTAWDHLGEQTVPDFIMQYDTANGMAGGADPVQPIRDWPGRGVTVHLKEWSGEHGAKVIGEGMVPWRAVFEACESVAGTEWYIVEHETYEGITPMDAIEKCIQNLRAMGK